MHEETNERTGRAKWMIVLFLITMAAIFAAIVYFTQTAKSLLPQADEILTITEAANLLERGEVDRILIQEEQDIFLYQPGAQRPLYLQLQIGETFTQTMANAGINSSQFPPLTVEGE